VQPDICNGCGYCIVNCPFGVIDRRKDDGRAWKCTLCYDRLREDMIPACAKACPTESIQFGELGELREHARERVDKLHEQGLKDAYLYGASSADQPGTEGLHAFFLLVEKPEAYNLPPDPIVPTKKVSDAWTAMAAAAAGMALVAIGSVLFGGKSK
jgi:formate dehydrogenase iron-sulfur subunit